MPLRPIVANADVVFSGTVVSIVKNTASDWPSEIITFDVDRVWKGPVTARFRLHSFTKTPEPFVFDPGAKYVVVASKRPRTEKCSPFRRRHQTPTAWANAVAARGGWMARRRLNF